MKIMLLSLPGLQEYDEYLFPLGIGYLVGALKQKHEVKAFHFNKMHHAVREIKREMASFAPRVVGLTCTSFNRGFVRDGIRLIRSINKDVKIVVGGVHVSFLYEQALNNYDADVVVIGEGEKTFSDLCDAFEKNTLLQQVRGIAYKNNGEVVVTQPQESISNLDDLPMPDYSYAREYINRSSIGVLIGSRGCPVRCTFCSTSSYWGQRVRISSPQRVVDEMEMLVSNFNVKKIFFHDDTFNLGIERVKAVCKEIIDRGIRVEWACSCRVVPVSEEMIAYMVEAGCRHIGWGIETGSETMLKSINKKISLPQIRNAFDLSKKFSGVLATSAFIMVGNAGETEATIRETIEFLNSLSLTDPLSSSILYVLPGTLLYEKLKKEGHIQDESWANYDTIPYYTLENSFLKLFKWSKQINRSGNRIPFDKNRHFWNFSANTSANTADNKNIILFSSIFNFLDPKRARSRLSKCLSAGKIRF